MGEPAAQPAATGAAVTAAAPTAAAPQGHADEAPLITLRGITKVYYTTKTPVPALNGVDLEIQAGEFVSIMGPSGSGKSTLLHILGALDVATSGEYLLDGVRVTGLPDRELSRIRNRHFGFVFQSYNLFPELTALENVEVPMIYAGVRGPERRHRAERLLERFGLGHRMSHRPAELSGGEQQRVAIARALANGPTLLLADEPTGNLPTAHGEEIMSILQELNDEGMTLVVVTHDWRIASYGKRLVELQDGQIVGDRQIGPAERRLRPGVREVAGVEDGEQAPAGCQPEPGAGHEAAPGA